MVCDEELFCSLIWLIDINLDNWWIIWIDGVVGLVVDEIFWFGVWCRGIDSLIIVVNRVFVGKDDEVVMLL